MKCDNFANMVHARMISQDMVLTKKAMVYAQAGGDRLFNFYVGSLDLDIHPEQYLMALVTKHWVTVREMVANIGQDGAPSDEWIDEHLGDVINYMLLLEGLLRDRRAMENQNAEAKENNAS